MLPLSYNRNTVLLSILCLFLSGLIKAQSNNYDSLYTIVQKAQGDVNEVRALNQLSWRLISSDTSKARALANRALELSLLLQERGEEALAYNRLGRLAHISGNYESALDYYSKNLVIRLETKDTIGQCNTYLNMGNSKKNLGDYVGAMQNYTQALSLLEVNTNDDKKLEAIICNNLGTLYARQKKDKEALAFYKRSLNLKLEIGDDRGYAAVCISLGGFLARTGKLEEGKEYLNKALKIQNMLADYSGMARTLTNLGNISFELENYQDAIAKYQESIQYHEDLGNALEISRVLNNLGAVNSMLDGEEQAKIHYLQGLKISKEIDAREQQALFYENLSYAEEALGNYKQALRWYYLYDSISSVILNSETNRQISELQIQYDVLKKDGEMKLLAKEKREQDLIVKQQESRLKSGILILILLGVAAIASIIGFRQKQKANKLLESQKEMALEREKEKELLLKELNHRVKNNLQIISSMLSLQSFDLKEGEAQEAVKEGQSRIEALSLIHQKLYQTDLVTHVDMVEYIDKLTNSIAHSFGYSSSQVNINSNIAVSTMEADMAIPLGLIINELVNNSFKYAFKETIAPKIDIEMAELPEHYNLLVRDNGSGFKANSDKQTGGFGMELIQSLVKQIKASYLINHQDGFSIQFEIPKMN